MLDNGMLLASCPEENPGLTQIDVTKHVVALLVPGGEWPVNEFHHMIGTWLVMIGIILSRHAQRFLSSNAMRKIGNLSFSMYFVHGPIYWWMGGQCLKYVSSLGLSASVTFWLSFTSVSVVAAFILGHFFAKYIVSSSIIGSKTMESPQTSLQFKHIRIDDDK